MGLRRRCRVGNLLYWTVVGQPLQINVQLYSFYAEDIAFEVVRLDSPPGARSISALVTLFFSIESIKTSTMDTPLSLTNVKLVTHKSKDICRIL